MLWPQPTTARAQAAIEVVRDGVATAGIAVGEAVGDFLFLNSKSMDTQQLGDHLRSTACRLPAARLASS